MFDLIHEIHYFVKIRLLLNSMAATHFKLVGTGATKDWECWALAWCSENTSLEHSAGKQVDW